MIKFIRKEHIKSDKQKGKVIIYYSYMDIFLGLFLFGLVLFFINDYIAHHSLTRFNNGCADYTVYPETDMQKNRG